MRRGATRTRGGCRDAAGIIADERLTIRLEDFSPTIRPLTKGARRIEDAADVLDPSFLVDRRLQQDGIPSLLYVPFLRGQRLGGFVGVGTRDPDAFTAEHESALQSIADLLGLALEHERLWNLDAARRRRLDVIDSLLGVLAETSMCARSSIGCRRWCSRSSLTTGSSLHR